MTPALTGVAIAVLVGAVVALAARDGRATVIGLAVTLVLAPLVTDPASSPVGLAARLTGALLAAYVLWVAVRGGEVTGGSRLGWPAEALLATAAFVVGAGTHGLGASPLGPVEAQAVGFGLGAIALVPVVTGRDIVRIGVGLVVLVQAVVLVRTGLGGTPGELEQLLTAGLLAVMAGGVAALAWAAASDGGGFSLAPELRPRVRRPRDARPTVRIAVPPGLEAPGTGSAPDGDA